MVTFSIRVPTIGAAGVFNQTGFTSSIATQSLPAARSVSASRRSPQQIGFIPAQRMPDARNRCKSRAPIWVLPTPVSVPVMKRLTRLVLRARVRLSNDWRESSPSSTEKSSRHLGFRASHRRRDQDEASNQRHFARDCRCQRCFRLCHWDWTLERYGLDCPHSAKSPVGWRSARATFPRRRRNNLHRAPQAGGGALLLGSRG